MIHIEIGPFRWTVDVDGNEVVRQVRSSLATPWFEYASHHVMDRERFIKACILCGNLPKNCECGERQVLVNPIEMQEHLLHHDHAMFHHITGTDCGDHDDEE